MKIGSIIKTTVVSLTALAATSCERGPVHQIKPNAMISEFVDSFSREGQKVLKDTSYHFYGKDTLQLDTKDLSSNSDKFLKNADSAIPDSVTGQRVSNIVYYSGKSMRIIPTVTNIMENKFVNPKTVVDNKVFANKNGELFVPVKFYGQKNPELKKSGI